MSGSGHPAFWPFQVLGAVLVVAAAVCARVYVSGSEDLEVARAAREAGLPTTAIEYYGRASRWYLPLVGKHAPARREMRDLCDDLVNAGDMGLALRCHREIRGAILATRWLITPDADLLEYANRAIARLVSHETGPDGRPVLPESAHLDLLRRDETPDPWLSALAVVLFFAWLAVAGYGLWTSLSREGEVAWCRLGLFFLLALALAALWLVTLRFA